MLQFTDVFIVYIIEWLLLVCSEQFLFQGGSRFEIALILSYFALWFEETHATNQSDAKLKPITTWSPAFSRALATLSVFYFEFSLPLQGIFLFSDLLSWLLNFFFHHTQSKSGIFSDSINYILLTWLWPGSHLFASFPFFFLRYTSS